MAKGKEDTRTQFKGRWAKELETRSPEEVRKRQKEHMAHMSSMRKEISTVYTLEEIKEALIKHNGFVGNTANSLGIAHSTLRRYIQKVWPDELRPLLRTIREIRTDRVESKLLERIDDGSDYLIRYYLSSQAKDRGYGEQVAKSDGDTIVNILYVNDWRAPTLDTIEGDYEKLSGESGVSEGDEGPPKGKIKPGRPF